MPTPTRLELTWIGKHLRPKLEPRILLERPEHSHAAPPASDSEALRQQSGPSAQRSPSPNMLIHGDNLLALKALEHDYTGKVKCVCIDPPYNTGSAFTHYDDGLEHSTWLSLMRDRLEIMRKLLSEDGSIWVFVDDSEAHYLKVMMDEIFGRGNFVSNIVWEKKYTVANDAKYFSDNHDHIIVFAKNKDFVDLNRLPRTEQMNKAYTNPDNHRKGPWKATPLQAKSGTDDNFVHKFPNGISWSPPAGRYSAYGHDTLNALYYGDEIWFGKDGGAVPARKTFLAHLKSAGTVVRTLWRHDEAGHNHDAKSHIKELFELPFDTPKPEKVLHRILTIATNPGDLVLDSFAGSGTTGAVAHKMGRRWIMCELGDHAFTHIVPRMRKVIDGKDPGGVTEATGWTGGGSFRTYELAPTLMTRDAFGQYVINPAYNPEMLAEAVCRHEGYTYDPSQEVYWIHGHATERAYVYVTTQTFTPEQLRALDETVGPERSLLVVCSAWKGEATDYGSLSLKKIPRAVLDRCDWGRDDYSLKVGEFRDEGLELRDEGLEVREGHDGHNMQDTNPVPSQTRMF